MTKFFGANHGEMYQSNNVNATAIQAVNAWHLVKEFSSGEFSGWTFDAGKQLAITAYANNGDGKTQVTCAGSNLTNGQVVSIAGTTNYDGVWVVEQCAANTFVIDTAFVADDGASTGEVGSSLYCSSQEAAGRYFASYSLTMTASNANDVSEALMYQNATYLSKSEMQRKLAAVGDYGNGGSQCIIDVSQGDYITVAIRNLTGANNFTVRDANISLIKI